MTAWSCSTFTDMKNSQRLIILSSGRSGTSRTAMILNDAGLEFGHEKLLKHGGIGWTIDWSNIKENDLVFHQVRHPVHTISSMMSHVPNVIVHQLNLLSVERSDNHLLNCMRAWYYWNLVSANCALWTFCVEDLYDDRDVIDFMNLQLKKVGAFRDILPETYDKTINSRPQYRHKTKFKDLVKADADLAHRIRIFGERLNYEIV